MVAVHRSLCPVLSPRHGLGALWKGNGLRRYGSYTHAGMSGSIQCPRG